jgi:hypothetical protein
MSMLGQIWQICTVLDVSGRVCHSSQFDTWANTEHTIDFSCLSWWSSLLATDLAVNQVAIRGWKC